MNEALSEEEEKELRRPAFPLLWHVMVAGVVSFAHYEGIYQSLRMAQTLEQPSAIWLQAIPWAAAVIYLIIAGLVALRFHKGLLAQMALGFLATTVLALPLVPLTEPKASEIPLADLLRAEEGPWLPQEVRAAFEQRFATKTLQSSSGTTERVLKVPTAKYTPEMRAFLMEEMRRYRERK